LFDNADTIKGTAVGRLAQLIFENPVVPAHDRMDLEGLRAGTVAAAGPAAPREDLDISGEFDEFGGRVGQSGTGLRKRGDW